MFGFFGPRIPQISSHALAGALGKPEAPVIVDVREPGEYAEGHIPGSKLIPLGSLPSRAAEIPSDREVVLVCRSGARSNTAAKHLLGAGYKVANLTGGMIGWRGPVER